MQIKLNDLAAEIRSQHSEFVATGRKMIEIGIDVGRKLILARGRIQHGAWEEWLKIAGLSRKVAHHYIHAAHFAAANPDRAAFLIRQGSPLVQLLRDAGCVKPCEGGGYRSETYQRRKLLADHQMDLPFQYEDFEAHVRCLITSRNVSDLADSSLEKLDHDLTTALARVREIKSNRLAIAIPAA